MISLVLKVHFKSRERICIALTIYTMSETSNKVGLSAPTLRYYEKEKLIPEILRNEAGNRVYSETDIEWILFIKTLRHTDMPIHLIKQYVSLFREGEETMKVRKDLIEAHTKKVQEEVDQKMKNLKILQRKVRYYHTMDRRTQKLNSRAFKASHSGQSSH